MSFAGGRSFQSDKSDRSIHKINAELSSSRRLLVVDSHGGIGWRLLAQILSARNNKYKESGENSDEYVDCAFWDDVLT